MNEDNKQEKIENINSEQFSIPDSIKLKMFELYCEGKTANQISKETGVSKRSVYHIAQNEKWREKKKLNLERNMRRYGDEVSSVLLKSLKILNNEITRLAKKVEDGIELTPTELGFASSTYNKFTKERRLEEGKPTEAVQNSGAIHHIVTLPPGAKRFGVIPPASNVKVIEQKSEEKQKDESASEDDL